MKSIITLAATLTLAITLTLTACEEKKKQDGTTTTATEPAAEAATQEAVVEEPKVVEVVKGSFTDTRDNKTYKTIKIGEQVWMAENLNYAVKDYSMCYDNKPANCKKYGRLYDWGTAKKACPSGWHLPSKAEYDVLIKAVGGETATKNLKAKSGWNDNGNGTDNFGFAALPGGLISPDGFEDIGNGGNWWSSSKDGSGNPNFLSMINSREDAFYGSEDQGSSYSVRCIKD